MEKISNTQVAEILKDASATLRAQQSYIGDLEEKLASRDRRERVEKIASEMHRKGLELDTSVNDLADRLEKTAADGKLDAFEQAVELVGPNMTEKIGQPSFNPNSDVPGGSGPTELERFIVGGVG